MSGLEIAADMARDRRDAAVQVLAQARQKWLAGQVQLDQLESYAQECTARWATRSLNCTPELMRHHYQFMERLDHAIALQTGIVRELGQGVERAAVPVREAEARLESLRQLVQARERELQLQADRRAQKQTDEQAALQHRRHGERSEEWR
ncbi:hypothetical protein APR50_38260 [Variovorax paradoxus]|jgi:flagellar FliJ protein|uniref:flagellar export protein FliJ n=1 Tax=Variovorax TaxID=34072 RepID=UPI0006E54858|nr:flagellar FliJ family protein [Variovorax sp. CY25R-8]KPU93912.1 hypothetical protein APR50_38260 [Variovorax paradoxus]KPU99767.1 hypothetical protein APR52_01950 [Variovorax paradoxus]KPV03229.1 hypothetical protein APR51_44705 [Variovorax paradoxus]KPV08239.1 hypothetical protein APR49_15575 [Variovorax paradoxus]KPV20588.1 hypothetical protein APR47_39620 [Variovorax paradoxus]